MNNFAFKILTLLFLLFWGGQVFADSSLRLVGPNQAVSPGSEFVVAIEVDSDEIINALDFEIIYDPESLEFLGANDAGSVVDFWQSKPSLAPEGVVKLSGGITQGFSGDDGLVAKIYFQTKSSGTSEVNFSKSDLYVADGRGTLLEPVTTALSVSVLEGALELALEQETEALNQDTTPAELTVSLFKNPDDRNRLLAFNAKDQESGVAKVETRYKKWSSLSLWQETQNPTILPKGVWYVEVRAVNGAGLETVEVISEKWRMFSRLIIPIAILIILTLLVILVYNKYNKFK